MILSIIIHHPKPHYYKHAPTLFLYVTIHLVLVSPPLLVTAQDGHGHHSFQTASNPLVMGIVLAIATVIVVVMFVVLNLCWQSRTGQQVRANAGPGYRASKGLDPSLWESFPVFKYSEVAAHRAHLGPLECAVCLSPFEPDEKLRLLPKCNHVFHVECLDPWFLGHSTCPLCRTDLVPEAVELNRVGSGRFDESPEEVNEVGSNRNELEVRDDIEEGHVGKHRRWKSTGHVAGAEMVEEESWTRFTLMLPEKEMKKYGEVTHKFKRTRSSI